MYNRKKRKFYRLIIILLILFIPFISIGYSALQTVLDTRASVAMLPLSEDELYEKVVRETACVNQYTGLNTDRVGAPQSSTNIYFEQCADKRNVIFANMCWQIIRTTDTGGVKMIYNGPQENGQCLDTRSNHNIIEAVNGGSSFTMTSNTLISTSFTYDKENSSFVLVNPYEASSVPSNEWYGKYSCGSTSSECNEIYLYRPSTTQTKYTITEGHYSKIARVPINGSYNINGVGYMINDYYQNVHQYRPTNGVSYRFGTSYTYDETNNTYTLSGTTASYSSWSTYAEMGNKHYTCWNNTGICTSISYIYATSAFGIEYINLENNITPLEALDISLNDNDYNSSVKTVVEAWYDNYLTNYSKYIENTAYCNNRNVTNLRGFDPSFTFSSGVSSDISYNPLNQWTDLSCPRLYDQFLVGNEYAPLEYAIFLPTTHEMYYLPQTLRTTTDTSGYYTITPTNGQYFTVVSSSDGSLNGGSAGSNSGNIRPVISIKPGTIVTSGTGSVTDPYLLEVNTYNVTYNNRYLVNADGSNKTIVKYLEDTNDIFSGYVPTPTNSCNTFVGWYENEGLSIPFNIENHINEDIEVYAKYSGFEFCFPYTGAEENFIAYTNNDYLLEAWGGQAGNTSSSSSVSTVGAFGGYSKGVAHFTNKERLYIQTGGRGASGTKSSSAKTIAGGYNGGGNGYQRGESGTAVGGGGGASHIALSSGLLTTFSDATKQLDLIIVAGGGGGGHTDTDTHGRNTRGGAGGGSIGGAVVPGNYGSSCSENCVTYTSPTGGTQTAGGKGLPDWTSNTSSTTSYVGTFGKGATGKSSYGGGGGGFYGGGSGQYVAGGGGSGYLNTSLLTNYGMWAFTGSSGDNTTVVTTSNEHISQVPNTGAGFVKISVVPPNTVNVTYNLRYLTYNGSNLNVVKYYENTNTIAEGEYYPPTNSCNTFTGWFTDDGLTQPFDTSITPFSTNITLYAGYSTNTFCFPYVGKENAFYTYTNGNYKLEVWGARGGGSGAGNGGYSYGTYTSTTPINLYIHSGGLGGNSKKPTAGTAGYNGGGAGGKARNSSYYGGSGGGGATHIATSPGLLKDLVEDQSSVLIVAGGGGGFCGGTGWDEHSEIPPGHGGGCTGTKGKTRGSGTSTPGNQTAGYAFGQGGPGRNSTGSSYSSNGMEGNGGSGGGWYGGKTSTKQGEKSNTSGAGGSGYVNTTLLIDYWMYCYTGCTGSYTTATSAKGAHVANKANSDAGYAMITIQ